MKTATQETIAALRSSRSSLDCFIERTFHTNDTAHKWLNRQDRNYRVVVLDGKWKTGDVVPWRTPARALP